MTRILGLLYNVHDMEPILMELPNGYETLAM